MTEGIQNEYLEGKLLLIDKSLNWTSFDVVNKVRYSLRKSLGIKKIKVGHAGTLDPLASGLLILCTGKKTKSIDTIQKLEKKYSGIFKIGATTSSFDLETEVENHRSIEHVSEELIASVAKKFSGEIEQIPPVFSAVKHGGKRAYELAREGQTPELKARTVTIHELKLKLISRDELEFEITCSKGTYIRSLARDIGEDLGCGAYISKLRRESIGSYHVSDAMTVEETVEAINQSAQKDAGE